MDFAIEHAFGDAAPGAVADAFADVTYQRSLKDLEPLKHREVLSQEETGAGVVRRVRCVLAIDLGKAKAFVGDGEPAWVEEWRSDAPRRKWTWVIHPEVAPELLRASGTLEVVPDGAGSLRRITGHVAVRVPLYGGRVEGWIVDGLERAYDEEADRLRAWLEAR